MSRPIVTGAEGFLGWHLRCRLHAAGVKTVPVRRDFDVLASALDEDSAELPVVYHLAGVNRAESDDAVEHGNIRIAEMVADKVRRAAKPIHLVYANSVHESVDNAYGRGKRRAADILRKAVADAGGTVQDVLLPNLFGEHGRPAYNSFVATFAHEVAAGRTPEVSGDREIPLLHAQKAAQALIHAAWDHQDGEMLPQGTPRKISAVLVELQTMHAMYVHGELPDIASDWSTDLFNTYRSYLGTQHFPLYPQTFDDPRGRLFETVRMNGGVGQAYASTTRPGQTRGEHWHLQKFERFVVVAGQAEIAMRRLFSNDVVRFRLDGSRPGLVDMPTMWVHNITNVGTEDLVTMFWSDQLLDRENPDQFAERVEVAK